MADDLNKILDDLQERSDNGDPLAAELLRTARSYELKPPEENQPGELWGNCAFTLADAYKDRPPTQYVAEGLFSLPSLNIVYGAPGCLKSFLMADLAVCVAGGVPWLEPAQWKAGATEINTLQSPVMWLDFDNGADRTHERIGALAKARKLPEDAPFYYYSMPMPWLNASKITEIDNLIFLAIKKQAKLIIIDNLGNVSGGVDENTGQMIGVLGNLRRLAENTGAAVITIHHQRKSTGANGRAGETLRGHSSIESALDLALLVTREESSETIEIKSTKTRGTDVYPFSANFTFDKKDNGILETAKFYRLPSVDDKSGLAIEREILAALTGENMKQAALVQTVKNNIDVGINRIRDTIDRMEQNKKIHSTIGAHNAKIYNF